MSLQTNLSNLATRIATENKSIRTMLNGNVSDLSALTTSVKTNLVAAINELDAAVEGLAGGSGAESLDDLTDVVITSPAAGHIPRHNGTNWVNVLGTTHFDAQGAATAAQAASQPLNTNLTAISALTTQAYGRALLAIVDQAALMALLIAATTTTPGIVPLATNTEALTGTNSTKAVTPAALQAKIDALVGDAPGLLNTLGELSDALGDDPNFAASLTSTIAAKQPLDATLTALAGVTTVANKMIYANGSDSFLTTDLTAFARTILDDGDAATVRTTIDVWSKTEIGNPETNLVTVFEAGLV